MKSVVVSMQVFQQIAKEDVKRRRDLVSSTTIMSLQTSSLFDTAKHLLDHGASYVIESDAEFAE